MKIQELAATDVIGLDKRKLAELIWSHRDVLTLTDLEMGQTGLVTHRIDTGATGPIKNPPHRASPAKMAIIKEEVQIMLQKGVIQRSKTPYSPLGVPKLPTEVGREVAVLR